MRLFFLLLTWLCLARLSAQTADEVRCGNETFFKNTLLRDTALTNQMRRNDEAIQLFLSEPGNMASQVRQPLTIPVVVHVVWHLEAENICDAAVLAQIEALNRDFSGENPDVSTVPAEFRPVQAGDIGLRFCLAAEDAEGKLTTGIVRIKTDEEAIGLSSKLYFDSTGGSSAWNPDKYLNIWVANTSSILAGFGTYPGLVPAEKSGLVIHPRFFGTSASGRYNMGRTAIHELGHYLGLYHLWGDCATDDGIDDTPPQMHSHSGCPQHPQISCSSSNMFMNYMDYVDDRCMMMFTKGQKEKMLASLTLFRPGLTAGGTYCGPHQKDQKPAFRAYPNPSNGVFTLEPSRAKTEDYTLAVFTCTGQSVQDAVCIRSGRVGMEVNLSQCPDGIYFLVSTNLTSGEVSCQKLVVQHRPH